MNRDERLRQIQQAHDSWQALHETSVRPDPAYAKPGPSQYPEGIVDVSAPPRAQAELVQMIGRAGRYLPSPSKGAR